MANDRTAGQRCLAAACRGGFRYRTERVASATTFLDTCEICRRPVELVVEGASDEVAAF